MIKKSFYWILFLFVLLVITKSFWFAQVWTWWKYWDNPMRILDTVVDKANQDFEIQETALDWVTDQQWWYPREYKIANTLEYFRSNIQPYMQWLIYIWLTLGVILLIYNWFLMVTNSIHDEWDISKIKKNIMNISIGVWVLTWFYFLIKLMVAIINTIFGSGSWWSGFS